ncbi:MAG: BtpA/SgcQ family protein [Acidimicrobiia bacterium]
MTARLVAMVHLGPLPGAPRFTGDFDKVLEQAVEDALILGEAGFDALLVENYGDAPYFADDVPKVTVAAVARAVATVRAAVDLPLGVNVLRNDALAALAVAAATGADFVRVNVLSGMMFADQGLLHGRAAEVGRLRATVAPQVEVLADVFVKHAVPPGGLTIEQAAADTFERGGADALVVTGPATGRAPESSWLAKVRRAVPEAPVLVGSGVTKGTVKRLLGISDGVIVGTDLKQAGRTENPVDPLRARAFVRAAR